MVKKKINLLCFDLLIRTQDENEPPRMVNDIKLIGKKSDAFKRENHIPYLNKEDESGFPINIHIEKWQFEMDEKKFMELADTKTKIEKENVNNDRN